MKPHHLFICTFTAGFLANSLWAQQAIENLPQPTAKTEVGVSSRDGITISGGEVFMTRNGRTEKLIKEVVLPNGLIVKPDGTVTNKDGGVATLRPTQVLSFEGMFTEAPVIESTAPKATPVIVMPATRAAPPATPMPATPMPRKGPIQAGDGVQK